ncbi:MAG: sigma-70 family RNA polymerase sigma factor [Chloroflexota bacterium]
MGDRELVLRARGGDRDAYERLAAGVADRLFRLAFQVVRDVDRAEDAVQQTLVAIWTDLPSLRDPDRFDAWTYRLAVRFCLAESRRHRRMGVTLEALTDGVRLVPDDTEAVLARDRMERAFRALTPEHRAVLALRHQAGLALPEVAEALGVPYGTVASRLHRATQQLRAALDADDRLPSPRRATA